MEPGPAPAAASRPWWAFRLPAVGAAAALLGGAAAWTDGTPRRVLLLLLYLSAVAVAALATTRFGPTPDKLVGGAGYRVPPVRLQRLLHPVLSLAYNTGLMVIVLAALMRSGLLLLRLPRDFAAVLPLAIGAYVALLALAIELRVHQQGGIQRTWYTRAHGWILAGVSMPIAAAAAVLAFHGEVRMGTTPVLLEDDVLVLVLAGVLGVGTQLYLAASLPTLFDLASSAVRAVSVRRGRDTPPFVYAGVLALAATLALGLLLVRFDVLAGLDYLRSGRVALALVLIPAGVAVFFGSAAIQIWREGRRGLYRKRLSTKLRNDLLVYGSAAGLGGLGAVLLAMTLTGRLHAVGPLSGQGLQMDLIMFTLVATMGPIGVYLNRQDRRVDAIESRLPDFLSDLAETRRAGLTLAASLHSCALSDYGPLSPEVRKMSQQVAWGIPFNDALGQFAQRVKTSLVERSTSLIIQASRTGGSVAQILKAAAKDAQELKGLEQDRRVQMLTYLIVIYVVFGVFLLVIGVIDGQFVPQVLEANRAADESGIGADAFGNQNAVEFGDIHFAYYLGVVVQSVGNGIVGGVISEGRVRSGFRHAAYMTLTSWLVFRFFLAP